jgi:hypothetical protein
MAKFRDMVTGMGFDGSSPEAMQKSIQGKLGSMMKGVNMPGMGDNGQLDPQAMMKDIMSKMPPARPGQGQMPGSMGSIDPNAMMQQIMSKMPKPGMTQGTASSPSDDMDFKPGNQSNLLQVDNPEYVARRAAALQKPGAVVGHTTMESNNELASWLKIAGIK